MKRGVFVYLLFLLVFLVSCSAGAQRVPRAGAYHDLPFVFLDATGALQGLYAEVIPFFTPRWLYLLFGVIVAIVFFGVVRWTLRRMVQGRTRELQGKNVLLEEEVRRRKVEERLRLRFALEETFSQVSLRLLSGAAETELVSFVLARFAEFLQARYLLALLPPREYRWPSEWDVEPLFPRLLRHASIQREWEEHRFFLCSLQDVPEEDRALLVERKIQALFALPLVLEGREGLVEGGIGEENTLSSEEFESLLPLFSQHLGTILGYVWALQRKREEQRWFEVALRSVGDAVITADPSGRVTFLNPVAEQLTGWSLEEAWGRPVEEVFRVLDESTRNPLPGLVQRILERGHLAGFEDHVILVRRDGTEIAIDDSGALIRDEEGNVYGVVLVFRDVTEKRAVEAKVREGEKRYRMLFSSMVDGFALLERTGEGSAVNYIVLEANPAFEEMTGKVREEIVGKPVEAVLPEWQEVFAPLLQTRHESQRREIFLSSRGAYWEITLFVLGPRQMGMMVADVTARRRTEERIRYFTFHDVLTGLYNRLFAEEEIQRLDNSRNIPLSVIFADMNGLKFTNDAFGHDRGDELLKRAAGILSRSCRRGDVVARWGGDEFLIVLPHTSYTKALEVAQRINEMCAVEQENDPLFFGLALGVATKENPERGILEAVTEAEDMAYQGKFFDRHSREEEILSILWKAMVKHGVEREEEIECLEDLALRMVERLSLSPSDQDRLRLLARFHDVGKILVPREVLSKRGVLSREERALLRRYPLLGRRIAQACEKLSLVAEEISSFREHWDGGGYPSGMKNGGIPLLARLLSIAEAYCALRFPRPYRERALSREEALEAVRSERGKKFDPDCVDILLGVA